LLNQKISGAEGNDTDVSPKRSLGLGAALHQTKFKRIRKVRRGEKTIASSKNGPRVLSIGRKRCRPYEVTE